MPRPSSLTFAAEQGVHGGLHVRVHAPHGARQELHHGLEGRLVLALLLRLVGHAALLHRDVAEDHCIDAGAGSRASQANESHKAHEAHGACDTP